MKFEKYVERAIEYFNSSTLVYQKIGWNEYDYSGKKYPTKYIKYRKKGIKNFILTIDDNTKKLFIDTHSIIDGDSIFMYIPNLKNKDNEIRITESNIELLFDKIRQCCKKEIYEEFLVLLKMSYGFNIQDIVKSEDLNEK